MLSSGTAFLLFFTALYLLESVTLCSGSVVIFFRGATGAVKYRFAKKLPEFGRGRLYMAPLFPPAASLFITGSLPVFFSNRGFCSVIKTGEGAAENSFYSFDNVERIGVSHNAVTVNGIVFCKTHSEHEAEWWKERLLRLARADAADRGPAAYRLLDEIFDSGIVEKFITEAAGRTFFLSIIINMLFMYCFLVVPAVTWIFSIALTWHFLLAFFFAQASLTVVAFVCSYRKIFQGKGIPWSRVISMVLYTPSLLRCMDIINKTSLSVFHPAAVARVLDNSKVFRELLSYYYREYSIAPLPQCDADSCEVISWNREHAAERVLAAAEESNMTIDELLAPPVRKDEEIKTYCPLCHEQYVLESGSCSECGVALKPYGRS